MISAGFISDSDDSRAEVITLVREVVVEHNGKETARGVEQLHLSKPERGHYVEWWEKKEYVVLIQERSERRHSCFALVVVQLL